MPEPYSKVCPGGTMHFNSGRAPFESRPILAQKAMVAIADWAHVELGIKVLFVEMLGANPRPAATVFSALTGSAAQTAALRAIADLILDEDLRSVFYAIAARYKTVAKARNRIAHWVWGYVQEVPDAIALIDPDAVVEFNVWKKDTKTHIAKIRAGEDIKPKKAFTDGVWLYYERDFDAITRDIHELYSLVSAFGMILAITPIDAARHILRHAKFRGEPEADAEYRRLLGRLRSEPQIAEFLAHQLRRQKNRKPGDPLSPDEYDPG